MADFSNSAGVPRGLTGWREEYGADKQGCVAWACEPTLLKIPAPTQARVAPPTRLARVVLEELQGVRIAFAFHSDAYSYRFGKHGRRCFCFSEVPNER